MTQEQLEQIEAWRESLDVKQKHLPLLFLLAF